MNVGDKVRFSRQFLKTMGHRKRWADARGTVVELRHPPLRARVRWDSGPWQGETKTAIASNLEPIRA